MDLQLEELDHLNIAIDGYDMLCSCTYEHQTAIVWIQKKHDRYHYILKKYNALMKETATCEFSKKLRYDLIRMYHNICILVNLEGGKDKERFIKNTLLITMKGIILKEFTMGMGLRDISISPQGTIWCGYDNDGVYKEYPLMVSKGQSCMIAAWNFFGELIYEMEYPLYDETFGFFQDCYSLYAKDNDEVYFFYYDKFDLCVLKNMKERELITFEEDPQRPFNFTIKEDQLIVYFEPYLEDVKSLASYRIKNGKLTFLDTFHFFLEEKEIHDYQLYINEDTLLLQHDYKIYQYIL